MIKQDFTPSKILNYITNNNDIRMQEFAKNINNLNLEVGQLKFLLLTSIEFMKYDYSIYFLDYDNLNELFDNKKNIYVYELLAKHLLNNEKNKLVPFIIKLFVSFPESLNTFFKIQPDFFRYNALWIADAIDAGMLLDNDSIGNIVDNIQGNASTSVVFKSIKNSPYNYKLLLAYAAKKNYIDLLPQTAQDIFIF